MKKVLLVDYITGGGYAEENLPLDRLAEGYALLRTLVEEFALAGYKIATLIDQRLMQYIRIAPIHDFRSVGSYEEFISGITDFSDTCDYSITVAPESHGILRDLSAIMSNSNSQYLGCNPDAVDVAADKLKTMEVAKELDLNVPATLSPSYNQSFDSIVKQVKVIGYPLIVKPIDGVGCKGLTKADNIDELRFGLQSAHAVTNRDECLVQEYIEGMPISTTLLADGERVLPISINRQNLRLSSKNSFGYYLGGEIPLNLREEKQKVLDTSISLVKKLGLTGFVGVDLVLSKEGLFVMEVNPRITVPIIGLRDIISQNLAELLIDFIVDKKEIDSLTLNGHASFTKITIPSNYSQRAKFEKVARIDGVRSPPFFIGDSSNVYAFLVGEGATKTDARKNFQRVKNELLSDLTS